MAGKAKNPTEAMRLKASEYPGVVTGTSCTQASFKANKKAFLYTGPQGGRFKAMFKLDASLPEAKKLATSDPDLYEVNKMGWVVVRFTAVKPMPKRLWERWLDESYQLCVSTSSKKKVAKKKTTSKKVTNRKK